MAGIFNKWKQGLQRTRKSAFGHLANLFGVSEITQNTWDDLEAQFIKADIGVQTTTEIIESLKSVTRETGIIRQDEYKNLLYHTLLSRLNQQTQPELFVENPSIVLLIGVNGSGKTTTAAKLGFLYKNQGKKVILGAADTYRAAAVEQLEIWANRLDIPVIMGQPGADPGAVAYDTVQAAVARKYDLAIIDTAGRLHTRYNLMEELKKVYRVVGKALAGAPHACWLVLDATTGQNALLQSKEFCKAVPISGIILAKLDSSAKGGMTFAIQKELNLPIYFAGLGEKLEDLVPFDRESFIKGIIEE